MDMQVADILVGLAFQLLAGESQVVVERVELQAGDFANVTAMVVEVIADYISWRLSLCVASRETRKSGQKQNKCHEMLHFCVSIEPRQFLN